MNDDLISRQVDIQEILDCLDNVLHPLVSPDHWNVYSDLYDMVEQLGTNCGADIIRCKDCKYYKTEFCAIDLWTDKVKIYKARPDDFCSRAARRE